MTTITPTTGTITSAGIGSGLDVNSIISSLMAVESQPLTALQSKATNLQTDLSAFGQVQSLVSSLQDAAKPLFDPAQFKLTNTSSTDPTSVSAADDQRRRRRGLFGLGVGALGRAVDRQPDRPVHRWHERRRHRQHDDPARAAGTPATPSSRPARLRP